MKKLLSFLQCSLCATLITIPTSQSVWAGPTYVVTDLGTLGFGSGALAISDNGYIVGESSTIDGLRATLFNAGGSPVGFAPGSYIPFARAYGVNNNGQAVGEAAFSPWGMHAAVFSPSGNAIDLGTLGGTGSQANAINNNGQIVGGSSTLNNASYHATLFPIGGSPVDLDSLVGPAGWSYAQAINNVGQIVGNSSIAGLPHATLFGSGASPTDLGVLDMYSYAAAFGINDAGVIVGTSYVSAGPYGGRASSRATLFSIGGSPTDLGALGGTYSRADGVNGRGQIVGMSTILGDLEMHAAIFGVGVTPIDLNDLIDPLSGWTLLEATAINANGEIVGYGSINGQTHAFLAAPTSVPEPGTFALLTFGLAGLCASRSFKKWGVTRSM